MTEFLRSWLMGVVCAAMTAALAEALTPRGGARRGAKLAGGLLVLLAVIRPVAGLDAGDLALYLPEAAEPAREAAAALTGTNAVLTETIIARKTGAYIEDKAAELGISCRAEVTVEPAGESGVPVPAAAEISGALSPSQREELTALIAGELDIPPERQVYRTEESE